MMDSFRPLKVAKQAGGVRGSRVSQELIDGPARRIQSADELTTHAVILSRREPTRSS